ncbi:MAG: OmpW/AlkL family protein [Silanimonas sp.]
MRSTLSLATLTIAAALASGHAAAQQFAVRAGYANVNPKSDNGAIAGAESSIDSNSRFVVGASYFMDDMWEWTFDAGATTFKHRVNLAGLGDVVSLKHHPISIGGNWHFLGGETDSSFSPYVGLGYNWTSLSDVRGINALAGAPIEIDDSSGWTAALGSDFNFSEDWFVRGEARYIDFDADVSLSGADIGTASVDPWVWSLQAGYRF